MTLPTFCRLCSISKRYVVFIIFCGAGQARRQDNRTIGHEWHDGPDLVVVHEACVVRQDGLVVELLAQHDLGLEPTIEMVY